MACTRSPKNRNHFPSPDSVFSFRCFRWENLRIPSEIRKEGEAGLDQVGSVACDECKLDPLSSFHSRQETFQSSGRDGHDRDWAPSSTSTRLIPSSMMIWVPFLLSGLATSPTSSLKAAVRGRRVGRTCLGSADASILEEIDANSKKLGNAEGKVHVLCKSDPALFESYQSALDLLVNSTNLHVFVNEDDFAPRLVPHFQDCERFHLFRQTASMDMDFLITLGGDGLIMLANTLYPEKMPVIIAFSLGSLGFLTHFYFDEFLGVVSHYLKNELPVATHMRLSCRVVPVDDAELGGISPPFETGSEKRRDDVQGPGVGCIAKETASVLNEIVIDRGESPYLSAIDIYCDGKFVTTCQADGLIIASPTGSTAYSMSAGGSICHPSVPAILITPICPHSLSFRPLIFPDSSVITCQLAENARNFGSVSFDGKRHCILKPNERLEVRKSDYSARFVCRKSATSDWFDKLRESFYFNTRMHQKKI